MTFDPLHLKKLVWAYILEAGTVTTGEWDYYSSNWTPCTKVEDRWHAEDGLLRWSNQLMEGVQEYGIDWDKTEMPQSSTQSGFEDSFSPSSRVESLLGTLVLKNGDTYQVGVAGAETRFQRYVELVTELMTDEARVKRILGE